VKTVILAGGLGTRLAEETTLRPKPMVEIGGRPLLWHIMNIYAACGHRDFVVAVGYKAEMIKEYFANFYLQHSDVRVDLATGKVELLNSRAPNWSVEVVETGLHTMTGGRLKRMKDWVGDGTFMMTYGDGLGAVDVPRLLAFHKAHGKIATITAVRPPSRFGGLTFDGDRIAEFSEKPQVGEGWINGGYMVFEPTVFDYIDGDDTVLERTPMERLANDRQLFAFKHEGFWQPMDTIREKHFLESLWQSGKAPWAIWT
jgi:glucose-1-phosphate cytidylyltransferase